MKELNLSLFEVLQPLIAQARNKNMLFFFDYLVQLWKSNACFYCFNFRYESNGIFVLGVGFFFFRQISTFCLAIFDGIFFLSFSGVVMAKKKGGQLRFCCDFRYLNAVTIKDAYPIPRKDKNLSKLGPSAEEGQRKDRVRM